MISQRKQSGFSLIEAMISIVVTMLATMLLWGIVQFALTQKKIYAERDFLNQGWLAATRYIKTNAAGIVSGSVSGFINPLKPSLSELFNAGYITSRSMQKSPLNGDLDVSILVGVNKDITAVICDTAPVTIKGKSSDILASKIASELGINGVSTNTGNPGTLTGASFQNIPSPLAGSDPVVCSISYMPKQ